MYTELDYNNSLYHSGIKGQRWGVRRYQNEDGTLTPAGKERYYKTEYKPAKSEYKEAKSELKKARKNYNRTFDKAQRYEDKKYSKLESDEEVRRKNDNNWSKVDEAEKRYEKAIDRHASSKEDYKEKRHEVVKNIDKKKLAIGLGTAAAVVATAYVMSDPNRRKAVKELTKKAEETSVKALKTTTKNAGKAMLDAAFASAGAIAATKVAKKLEAKPDASETEKNIRKIATDTATAGINSVARSNKPNNGNNQNGGKSIGKELSDKLGKPDNKEIAKKSRDWPTLMNDPLLRNNPDLKAQAKSLADAGYSIDQIKAYVYGNDHVKHSGTFGYKATIIFS